MNGIRRQGLCLALHHMDWVRADDPRAAVARTLEIGRVADAAGVDALWVSEDPDGWDAFGVLGALATVTDHIRLGTGVANPYYRHPSLLAASVATLDQLSGGRSFLGLGRGQVEWYREALGIAAERPLAALRETFDLLRAWWSPPYQAAVAGNAGDTVFPVRGWERTVAPVQTPPGPPVYLAAVGPKALALAGRLADGVVFNDFASETFLEEAIGTVRESARDAGRDPAAFRFMARAGVLVTDDPEPVLERRKAHLALINSLPGMDWLLAEPGFDIPAIMANVRRTMCTDEVLARGGGFPEMRRAGDLAAASAAIPTELMARLTVVGPLAEVRERLRSLVEIGVTDVFVFPPEPGEAAEEYRERLRELTEGDTGSSG
ncbi:MAG TPA: LLM class flavin-dependent oxidoreductase [Thermomicrobiales bacterium]|nr:LLM class flavin-dependent oxidoreductase [Thermomicrobiales bacterium]